MWYVVFSGFVLIAVLLITLLSYFKPHHAQKIVRHNPTKKRALLLGLPLIALAAGGVAFGLWLQHDQSSRKNRPEPVVITSSTQPKNAPSNDLPGYEVLSTGSKIGQPRLTVYISSNNQDKVRTLNAKLYDQYKKNYQGTWWIDYFDNKSVAEQYFTKISNPKVSTNDRKELTKHYIAIGLVVNGKLQLVFTSDKTPAL